MSEPKPEESGAIDRAYLKGIPAILKLAETVFALVAFICVVATSSAKCVAIAGFFNFSMMAGFVLTLILWLIKLLKLDRRICKCDCLRWPLVEFVYYLAVIIFFFFASLFMAIFSCKTAHDAGAAFGFFALAVYIVDTVLSFRVYTSWKSERHVTTTSTRTEEITTDTTHTVSKEYPERY